MVPLEMHIRICNALDIVVVHILEVCHCMVCCCMSALFSQLVVQHELNCRVDLVY